AGAGPLGGVARSWVNERAGHHTMTIPAATSAAATARKCLCMACSSKSSEMYFTIARTVPRSGAFPWSTLKSAAAETAQSAASEAAASKGAASEAAARRLCAVLANDRDYRGARIATTAGRFGQRSSDLLQYSFDLAMNGGRMADDQFAGNAADVGVGLVS